MLTIGTRIGVYEVIGSLGAGGMGEVYRARDPKLGRDVALKVLSEAFASDPERLARFEREAKTLASLNHPHIGHIYGFEQSPATSSGQAGVSALVMELVEGEDLSQRLARGAIPIDEALPIAKQIAEALEAAHRQGIIHRDLKPANIKMRPDGTVKVLDFGLAKLADPAGGSGGSGRDDVLNSPTITSPAMTERGIILGTAAYMAPEQAKGKLLDKRADNWAFGCVVFEMLTARRAFPGDDTSETLAAVLKSEPDWTALPSETPAAISRLLRRCRAKDPSRRLADIADARMEIEDALTAPLPATLRAQPTTTWPRIAIVVGASAVAFAIVGWLAARLTTPTPVRVVTRASIMLASGQQFSTGSGRVIAISPEGSQVLYRTPQGLYLRSLSSGESRLIAENGVAVDAINPAFSPDGQSIAYLTGRSYSIKATALQAGATTTLASVIPNTGGILSTISWDDDGVLVAAGTAGVLRFPAGANAPALVRLDPGEAVTSAQLLPDRDHVLFTLLMSRTESSPGLPGGQVLVQSVKSGVRQTIAERGGDARYVSTGHILYVLNGTLLAIPFDLSRLAVTGPPVVMIEGVRVANPLTVTAEFGVSNTGTLVYLPGPVSSGAPAMDLILIDRKGSVERLNLPPAAYETPRISPDGTQVAVSSDDGKEANVWVYDLSGMASIRRLTFGGRNRFPVWSADGTRVAFQSDREGDVAIFWQRADGSGPAERLTKPDTGSVHMPESWSPTGAHLLFNVAKDGVVTLWTLALAGRHAERFGGVRSLAPTSAVFSPDGRWLAYGATDVGRQSIVFVQPFPATGATYQVSREGDAHHPLWSRDGTELSFVPAPGRLEAVNITTEPSFSVSAPFPLANAGLLGPPTVPRHYDILKDGRFIGRAIGGGFDTGSVAAPRMHIILNWFEELKTRVPIR